jgi:hypothetical protein
VYDDMRCIKTKWEKFDIKPKTHRHKMDYTACDEWESAKLLHRERQRTTLNMEKSFYIVSLRKDRTALQWIPPVSMNYAWFYRLSGSIPQENGWLGNGSVCPSIYYVSAR